MVLTNKQAYYKLLDERPSIVAVLERDARKYANADALANAITERNDPAELKELIRQCAAYVKKIVR